MDKDDYGRPDSGQTTSNADTYEQEVNAGQSEGPRGMTAEPEETAVGSGPIDNDDAESPSREESSIEPETVHEKQTITELLYGVIAKPVATLRYISTSKPIWMAMLIYVAVSWIGAVASVPGSLNSFEQTPSMGAMPPLFNPRSIIIFTLIGTPFFSLVSMFIFAGILHLIALPLKGKGEYWGLFSAIGFASFPMVMSAPFGLIDYAINIGTSLYSLVTLPFTVWTIVLTIIGIRENYKFSTGRAVWTFFIPLIVLSFLLVLLIVGLAAIFIGAMSSL